MTSDAHLALDRRARIACSRMSVCFRHPQRVNSRNVTPIRRADGEPDLLRDVFNELHNFRLTTGLPCSTREQWYVPQNSRVRELGSLLVRLRSDSTVRAWFGVCQAPPNLFSCRDVPWSVLACPLGCNMCATSSMCSHALRGTSNQQVTLERLSLVPRNPQHVCAPDIAQRPPEEVADAPSQCHEAHLPRLCGSRAEADQSKEILAPRAPLGLCEKSLVMKSSNQPSTGRRTRRL